jgi:hypothetical protein
VRQDHGSSLLDFGFAFCHFTVHFFSLPLPTCAQHGDLCDALRLIRSTALLPLTWAVRFLIFVGLESFLLLHLVLALQITTLQLKTMAPAAQAPVKRANYDGSRPRFPSLEAWLSVYGNTEYAIYKRDAAPNPMTYEEWSKSEHVLGPFLWYTTLDVWEEDSSSVSRIVALCVSPKVCSL